MPSAGAEARAEQRATLNRIAHELQVSPDLGALLEELRPFEEAHDEESFEAEPRPGRPARLREGRPRSARAARRADARRLERLPGLAARARAGGLRAHASAPRAEPRAAPPVRRLLRLRRRPVRRRPRRLRAGHEDGRGRGDLRQAQGGAPADDPRGRRRRPDRRLVPLGPLPARRAAAVRARRARAVGDGPRVLAARQDRASVRDVVRADRHPPDDELPRGLAARDPLVPARVRARHLRAAGRSARTRARRSHRACRRRSTSRRAACGRTSSAAASRRGATSIRGCRTSSPTSSATCRSRRSIAR